MNEWGVRVRALADRWAGSLLVVALVLAAVGGWMTYGAYAAPGTHTEERTVEEWTVEGSFSHRATVNDAADGTVFEPGTTVRNRSVYFERVMPVLEGSFALTYAGTDAPLDLRLEQRLVVRSVEPAARDEEPTAYWERRRSLATTETTLRPGEQTTHPFSVNVTRTVQRASNVSERLGDPGEIRISVDVAVAATRRTAGAETRRLNFTLPIESQTGVYRVAAQPRRETFSRTETVEVPNDPGPTREVGGPLLLFVGALGAVGLVVARRNDVIAVSDAEREWLAYRDDRTDFEEWISTARLPDESYRLPEADAASLADLADIAIDTDSPVVFDPETEAYHVIHDGVRYTYDPPAVADESAAPPADRGDGDVSGSDASADPASASLDSGDESGDRDSNANDES
jgi:hypothetical protein